MTVVTRHELTVYRAHGLLQDCALETADSQRRLRRIRRLRRDLGLPWDVVAIIEPLLQRIEELEQRLVDGGAPPGPA